MLKSHGMFSMKERERAAQLSNVSLLYYGEGLTQSDIARRLRVSRVTVVNMLREARAHGVVEIHVGGEQLKESSLARDIREKYGLEDVYVADTFCGGQAQRDMILRQLGRVASAAFLNIVDKGDRIGVAWGETIMALTDALPKVKVEQTEVSQLIGSMISARVPASENCAIQMARQIGAQCFTLHAPALVATPDMARIFRAEPTIAAQLARLKALDMVVFSIGHVRDDTHLVAAGMALPEELEAARNAGAQGVVACRFIDCAGREIQAPPSDRLIAASFANLKNVRKKMLVVAGCDRREATCAALAGNLVTHLVVDRDLALLLRQQNA